MVRITDLCGHEPMLTQRSEKGSEAAVRAHKPRAGSYHKTFAHPRM